MKDNIMEYTEAFGSYELTEEELDVLASLSVKEQLGRFALRVSSETEYFSWCDTREGMPDGGYCGHKLYSLEGSDLISGVILRRGALVGVEVVDQQDRKKPLLFGKSVVLVDEYDDSNPKRHCAYTERASLIRREQ